MSTRKENMSFKEEYFEIWQQGWCLHKKNFGISADNEEAWQQLDRECAELDKRYADKPERQFLQSLLLAICVELERRARKNE